MTLNKTLSVITVLAFIAGTYGDVQKGQPSIAFGIASVSLGMTVEQIQEHLAKAGRHLKFLPDKSTAVVYANGNSSLDVMEGQVTFSSGRAIFAQYQMPNAQSAEDLAQEIAGAVDSKTRSCNVSNYSAHGTGGGFSQSIFDCGPKRFDIMTTQVLGSTVRNINVNIEIGEIPRSSGLVESK
jgi:hypothetical protein